jgi:hypothetical protein
MANFAIKNVGNRLCTCPDQLGTLGTDRKISISITWPRQIWKAISYLNTADKLYNCPQFLAMSLYLQIVSNILILSLVWEHLNTLSLSPGDRGSWIGTLEL